MTPWSSHTGEPPSGGRGRAPSPTSVPRILHSQRSEACWLTFRRSIQRAWMTSTWARQSRRARRATTSPGEWRFTPATTPFPPPPSTASAHPRYRRRPQPRARFAPATATRSWSAEWSRLPVLPRLPLTSTPARRSPLPTWIGSSHRMRNGRTPGTRGSLPTSTSRWARRQSWSPGSPERHAATRTSGHCIRSFVRPRP